MQPIDTPEGLVVYADWLLAQGNPQGELIIVQRARQSATRSPAAQRALRLREDELLHKHGAELAGVLPKTTRLCWRSGFVRELAARFDGDDGALLAEALRRPVFALLEHVSIATYSSEPWPPALIEALGALRQLRSLEVSPRETLDLAFVPATLERLTVRASNVTVPPLARLRALTLFCDEVEGLSAARQPLLTRVVTGSVLHIHAVRGLELHADGEAPPADELSRLAPRRTIVTLDEDGEDLGAGDVLRTTAQADERAFVLLEGEPADVKRALERVGALPMEGSLIAATREVVLGGKRFTAVELRSNEPQPSLLRMLSIELVGLLGRPVLEVALSKSSEASLFRAHERIGTGVTTWVAGRAAGEGEGAVDGLRRAVDRLFGLDPGLDAVTEVLLALDGIAAEVLRGERPGRDELPCCSPLEATVEALDEDEEEPEYEDEDEDYGYEEREDDEWLKPVVEVPPVAQLAADEDEDDEDEDEDDEDEDDEPFRDAADADIEEVLTQTPVALDDEREDGVERDPEQGLEIDPTATDPDSITASTVCEACRLNPAQQTCSRCGAEVCESCMTLESPVTCRDCRPATQPTVAAVAPVTRRSDGRGSR